MDLFNPDNVTAIRRRVLALTPESQPLWGTMDVGQMLAHCNVTYELDFEPGKHKPPGFVMGWMLRLLVKPMVVNDKPYAKSLRTAPYFLVTDERDFEVERERLLAYLQKTCDLGRDHFEGRVSHSFGALQSDQWNMMFYKHLDHHLRQFGQ